MTASAIAKKIAVFVISPKGDRRSLMPCNCVPQDMGDKCFSWDMGDNCVSKDMGDNCVSCYVGDKYVS